MSKPIYIGLSGLNGGQNFSPLIVSGKGVVVDWDVLPNTVTATWHWGSSSYPNTLTKQTPGHTAIQPGMIKCPLCYSWNSDWEVLALVYNLAGTHFAWYLCMGHGDNSWTYHALNFASGATGINPLGTYNYVSGPIYASPNVVTVSA